MMYLGLDTSSKAIHGAVVNPEEELVCLYKWDCDTKKSFELLTKTFSGELR